ncbi:MAG: hypothetical protein BMS9Abin26_0322 [Gammaproteobacteria bacterium]|nr:MAG: hypothetical protein BMS9Abin26_0322 [Gammaproteobacteria bacterium]
MRIYMQTSAADEIAPKYYQLLTQEDLLEGWWLIREWGVPGGRITVKRKHFDTFDDAMEAMMRFRDKQLRCGFKIVFAEGHTTAL